LQKPSKYLFIGITAVFVLLTIVKSFYYSKKNGGIDLRIRVVGSRLLSTDQSPYFYNWNPSDGEYFLAPSDMANSTLNGNVVTPATLYLIHPISWQHYPAVRMIWTIIQFILAFVTLYLLRKPKDGPISLLPIGILLTGLLCSDIWLLNIERGQIYIFYTFLFAVMYALYISKLKHGLLLSGFTGGLFILFRPFAAIITVVFLINGKRNWWLGSIAGFTVGCLLFVLPRPSLWQDYFKAMNMYASQYVGNPPVSSNAIEYPKPGTIEGLNNLLEAQGFNIKGLKVAYNYFEKLGIVVSQNTLYLLYGLTVLVLSFFYFRIKRKAATPQSLFLLAFLCYILAEFFVTVARGNYNLIQWLFPLSLVILQVKAHRPLFILLVTSFLLLHNFPFVFPYQAAFAELFFLGITIYCVFFTGSFNSSRDSQLKAS